MVTAVRDPVEHFLSAYNEILYRRVNRKRHVDGSTTHFEQFVRDFVGGPVSSGVYQGHQQLLEMAQLDSPRIVKGLHGGTFTPTHCLPSNPAKY